MADMPSRQDILDALQIETSAPQNPLAYKESYTIEDFLAYEGEEFVSQCYSAILKRPPDPSGLTNYTKGLRDGIYTKIFVIGTLRNSPEGKARGVVIHGLDRPYILHRVRCLLFKAIRRGLSLPTAELRRHVAALEKEVTALEKEVATQRNRAATRRELEQLRETIQVLQRDRLALARVLEKRVFSDSAKPPAPPVDAAFYSGLESAFRGSEDSVSQGLTCFLPWVEQARNAIPDFVAVDLGCGRGEWLRLMRDNLVPALGVDLNPLFVSHCRKNGLEVHEADLMAFMTSQPSRSLGLVSAFHILEHLDFAHQYQLLEETLRVLHPGGIAILETPNPRNILVGAGDFYRDPTHKSPVFPDTLSLMGAHLGFSPSRSFFFDPQRTALLPVESVCFADLNDYTSVSRDFVWIGVKA
ncbi:MAG: methyltransferase domain-containing protein [Desulfovibrionales bacterium]|nr:methyltransferase domain-containing protein [Desulfovibrionales bacterium]